MKTAKLLLACILFTLSAAAQEYNRYDLKHRRAYTPIVYSTSSHNVDSAYTSKHIILELFMQKQIAKIEAINDYHETHRYGYNQVEKPHIIFTSRSNRFSFALGGSLAFTSSYDFGGISNSIDFVPSTISVPNTYATKQKLTMSASTSSIYFKAIANTRNLGRVVIYMDTDFRGGSYESYQLRVKSAYISFLGLTVGRDATTFCDLSSSPTTIDFQGPNAYTFTYAALLRYERTFWEGRFKAGAALEMPNLNATYGNSDKFKPIPQRMPNIPIYLQFMWNEKRSSHVRASAIFRNLQAHNVSRDNTTSLLGWGVQLSGSIKCCDWAQFKFNGVYGEGITPYLQDLSGSGLDFIPKASNSEMLKTLPMYGAQASIQLNLTPRLSTTGGCSMVEINNNNSTVNPYKRGVYAFGNIFYKLTPRCNAAVEYLYGSRENMDNKIGYANRINLMLKCNF